jgi:uncharacterized protein with gpF-like domain
VRYAARPKPAPRQALAQDAAPRTTLSAIRPNAGTEARYRRRLQGLIRQMNASVQYWIKAKFKANGPAIAQDELPSKALAREIRKLARRWEKDFDDLAPKLAEYFAKSANQRSTRQLKQMLKDAGFAVDFKMTRAVRDVMSASINEQVSLIKSIPAKYFTDIEGSVMRAVGAGGDLHGLAKDLQKNYGVSYRRAAFIARDQNNKAMATITKARQQEAGITEAIWVHSGGGHEPRPTHVAAGKRQQRYDVSKGWYDPDANGKGQGAWIFPGQLPNCRCVSRPVIPGF